MPVYEYKCSGCDQEFEKEQRISDNPVKTCALCKSRKVKRLISQTSFVLKGGGWYSDLYSSKDKKDKAKKSTEDSSDSPDKNKSKKSEKTKKKSEGSKKSSKKKSS